MYTMSPQGVQGGVTHLNTNGEQIKASMHVNTCSVYEMCMYRYMYLHVCVYMYVCTCQKEVFTIFTILN